VFAAKTATKIRVYATAAGTTVVSAPKEITIKQRSARVLREWRFGPGSLTYDGGAEGTAVIDGKTTGTPWIVATDNRYVNNKDLTLPGGLTLTPSSGARWIPTQTQLPPNGTDLSSYNLMGVYLPGSKGTWGKIPSFGVPVTVTIIWTHTGETPPAANDERKFWIKIGNITTTSTVLASKNLADSATIASAVFKVNSTTGGEVTFGSDNGSLRIYMVKIE